MGGGAGYKKDGRYGAGGYYTQSYNNEEMDYTSMEGKQSETIDELSPIHSQADKHENNEGSAHR